jgi:hypothetical protein
MSKKDLSKASEAAVNKFFSQTEEVSIGSQHETEYANNNMKISNINNITKNNNVINNTKHTHITNKSKHYDERGKRDARYALLLDKKLKEDLIQLCIVKGNRSMNDYIVSLLIAHTELPENKKLLQEYSKLRNLK